MIKIFTKIFEGGVGSVLLSCNIRRISVSSGRTRFLRPLFSHTQKIRFRIHALRVEVCDEYILRESLSRNDSSLTSSFHKLIKLQIYLVRSRLKS